MNCEECGNEFRPSGHGKKQRYCSAKCKQAAYRKRRRSSEPHHDPIAEDMSIGTRSELDRREFERMMDDGVEDAIRLVRDRLKAALDDPGTPANTLPAIGRQYIELCERLQGMDGQADLFGQTDDMGVTEDVGASIV